MYPVTADAEQAKRTGGALLLWPHQNDAQALAVPGGEPWQDLHMTLYFFASDVTEHPQPVELISALDLELQAFPTLNVNLFAPSIFNPTGPEPCAVMLGGDSPLLSTLRHEVLPPLISMFGPQDPDLYEQHEPWIPHCTIGYGMEFGQIPEPRKVMFDRVTLEWAGQDAEFLLLD